MDKPAIHLLAVAGTCRGILDGLGLRSGKDLIRFVQEAVGPKYRVTGDTKLIESPENDDRGGRRDDARRAADLQRSLADNATAAVVSLRGGAWLTRILNRVDFDVLRRRRTGVALFGFSELTTVINIAARYRRAYCYYDMGPGFLRAGMKAYAARRADTLLRENNPSPDAVDAFATGWALGQFRPKFAEFFHDVVAMLEGRGSRRSITGKLVAGRMAARTHATFAGGNLTCFAPLLGTPFAKAADCRDRWLVIEDINELPEHVDRTLGQFTLAGVWEKCKGLLVGDFHRGDSNHTEAVVSLLKYHLPPGSALPVITTRDVGHVWPLSPLPIGRRIELVRSAPQRGPATVRFRLPWAEWKIR